MTTTMKNLSQIQFITALCLLVAGCTPPLKGGGDTDAGTAPAYYTCTVDPALVALKMACRADDGCPCGTHCQLGTCTASCQTSSDCSTGSACDGFGRCVNDVRGPATADGTAFAKGASVAPPVSAAPQGLIALDTSLVELAGVDTVGQAGVALTDGGVDGLVVVAPAGLEVQCADAGVFSNQCALSGLSGGARLPVIVRVNDASKSATYDVKLTTPAQVLSFRVRYTRDTPAMPAPLEGQYEGLARLTGLGSSARTSASPLPTALTDLTIPVKFTIYPEKQGTSIVELHDEFGVIFPGDKVVGQLVRDSNGNFQLRQATQAFVTVAGQGVDVGSSALSTAFEKAFSGVTLTLRTRYSGVIDEPSAPFVQWQLSLARIADLPSTATPPALPTPFTPGPVATRATAPFSVEAAVLSAVHASAATTDSLKAQAVLCTPAGAASPSQFAPTISAPTWTGDLSCTTTNPKPAEQLAFGVIKDSVWQVGPVVSKCMTDLRAGVTATDGAGCINLGRALTAMSVALEVDRQLALGNQLQGDAPLSSIAHRVVQEWLRTHLFVARQATQIDLLNDVLSTEAQVPRTFPQTEMLDLTGHAFDALLHPRIAMGLSRLNPTVLFAPDYRALFAPQAVTVANPRYEQTDGLPVTMVDALHDNLNVYATLYERARFVPANRTGLEASAQVFLRKSLVVAALAVAMSDNAHANNTNAPTWESKWVRALGLYGTGFAGLMRSIENLRAGRNPLDIDDKLDLPLYRVGDQVGALGRFAAVSDYLLGTGTSLDNSAIVPSKVLEAQAALDTARTAVVANLQQDFAAAQDDAARAGRLEAIRRKYGEQIQSLCGDPLLNANTVLLQEVDANACFVKPECRLSPNGRVGRMSPGDSARTLCTAALLTRRLGSQTIPELTTAIASTLEDVVAKRAIVRGQVVIRTPKSVQVQTSLGLVSVPVQVYFADSSSTVAKLPDDVREQIRVQCEEVARFNERQRPAVLPDPNTCATQLACPSGMSCVSGTCQPDSDFAAQTACYTGALGEQAVAIRSAAQDIAIARSEVDNFSSAYDLQMQKCVREKQKGDDLNASLEAHNRTMQALGGTKLAFDIVGFAADGVAACASTAAADTKFGTATVVSCAADAIAATAKSGAAGLQFAMDEAVRNHELAAQQISTAADHDVCLIEAQMSLVGMTTASLRVQKAIQDLANQFVKLDNQKIAVRVALHDGREALNAELDRTVPGVAMDFWLSDKVEAYDRAFRAARRAAYLGVLAVEYEFQVSTIERQNVLAANTVAELKSVLDRLRNLVATGTVRGHAPSPLHAVVSVRSSLLQLADTTSLPAGWHLLTDAQRFQMLLTSPRFAVYGRDGQYLGQQLPFTVAPLAALKVANTTGVPLLASTDCAERVWSVNATLAGTDLMAGDSTRPRMTLLKRNRFFSQWCTPAPEESQFQVSATRPSRNLFLDPFTDYLPGRPGSVPAANGTITEAAEADAFVSARLQPQLNVSRGDFEQDAFFNGSSTELAGRGLYGDYALFFPAEALALGSTGLKLEHLDDVLLRFDYVSVAQH